MSGILKNKVALVTGGSSGIGRASAMAFARAGAKVVIADIDKTGGEEVVRLIRETGGEASFVEADVAQAVEVEAMVEQTVRTFGRLDYGHNNAGIGGQQAPTADCTEENWYQVLNVNLTGTWLCMKYEIRQMLKQGGGCIVNTSSTAGLTGTNLLAPAYAASKHGIIGLTRTAAVEYAKQGIRVNAICPGIIRTPLMERHLSQHPEFEAQILARYPGGRMGTPAEVAEAVVWLCSDASSFVTGQALVIDGGKMAAQ